MKTITQWAQDHFTFTQPYNQEDTETLIKMVREEALDAVIALARKRETREFDEFADKVEALKSLP